MLSTANRCELQERAAASSPVTTGTKAGGRTAALRRGHQHQHHAPDSSIMSFARRGLYQPGSRRSGHRRPSLLIQDRWPLTSGAPATSSIADPPIGDPNPNRRLWLEIVRLGSSRRGTIRQKLGWGCDWGRIGVCRNPLIIRRFPRKGWSAHNDEIRGPLN